MPEMKRVEITSVPSSQKQKKVKWKQVTHRFILTLGDSSSVACPEYSFADLVKSERPLNGNCFDDPDEDKEVAAIAQRFEAKYGPKGFQSGKRKRTQEMDDFCDLGDGYDEADPFIDNTEAYDEVIPSTMTTQHGGFYINQGKLDFKCLDEDSSNEFISTQTMRKKKKRVLDSESEEETGAAIAKKFKAMKRKKQLESRGEKQRKTKLSNSREGGIIFKKKKIKNLDKLKIQKSVADLPSQKDISVLPSTPITAPSTAVTICNTGTSADKAATVANGVVSSGGSSPGGGVLEVQEEIVSSAPLETLDDSSSKSGDEGKGENQSTDRNSQLPSQLPPELMEAIEKIKQEAKETKEKKLRFFSPDINKLLLHIELGSRNLAWGSRTAIYNHLGEHLPCGKHALQRRAKKLRESQEDGQLKESTQKLREAIMKVMPALEEKHEIDVQKAKMDSGVKEETGDVREEASTESEGEEKSDSRKKPRGPRRKFQWNTEIRDLLLDIVSAKMKLYGLCKSRNQTAEEYLKAYLDSDIKPMWPQGWMQTRMLFKESRSAHEDLTKGMQQGKQRKASVVFDTAPSSQESVHSHVSKTEDVIEISSVLDSDEEKNHTVGTSLSKSDIKPWASMESAAPSSQTVQMLPSSSPSAVQPSKQSFKTTLATPSISAATTSSQKAIDISSMKRVTPVPVTVSSQMPSSQRSPKALSSEFVPPAASTPGRSGSDLQQHMHSSSHQRSPHQPKTFISQQKPSTPQQTVNIQQPKLPQEAQKATNLQQNLAASKSSLVVSKDVANLSRSSANLALPASKHINPVVAVNRIPETLVQKSSVVSKNSSTMLQQNQMHLLQNQQQVKMLNSGAVIKSHQTQKKRQQVGVSSTSSSTSTAFESQPANKLVVSSKQDSQSKAQLQQNPGQTKPSSIPNPQAKCGTVTGTSSLIQNSARPASSSGQSASGSSGYVKQSSPESKPSSSVVNIARSLHPATSPPSPSMAADLLNITSTTLSHSRTPSPQKSPISPEGNAALSLYEQIRSQLWHQEAMEDQALKNLALALKFGGSSISNFYAQEPVINREQVKVEMPATNQEVGDISCGGSKHEHPDQVDLVSHGIPVLSDVDVV